MLNKFEAVGIGLSVAIMAITLVLLRLETTDESILTSIENENQAAIAVVSEGGQNDDLYKAIAGSVNDDGEVQNLIIDDVVLGVGEEVKAGDTVKIDYIGTLVDGQEFDNSHKKGEAFSFTVDNNEVITGLDQGILGMKVGGQRILVIPQKLAYGSNSVGLIPKNSTLVFSIELLEVEK